jgi:signal transduction histidine kinase
MRAQHQTGPRRRRAPAHLGLTSKPHRTGMGPSIGGSIIGSYRGRLWAAVNSGPAATFCPPFTLPTQVQT